MFTPQRKVWPRWSLTSHGKSVVESGPDNSNSIPGSGGEAIPKGNALISSERATPFQNPVRANGQDMDMSDLNRETLAEKATKLENELYEYQYNMGLLLIEKKDWDSKYDELRQALGEAKDVLKREEAAHLIAISDIEKREEKLRNALGVEKQCVLDLEKTLHEMRSEYAGIRYTADSKLAEANALVMSIEEKSLEVESKLHAADAKLAEVNRKSSEIERKEKELEVRENALQRERLSFNSERDVHETTLSKQRQDMREWERKLQEGEERMQEGQRILNQREERANESDKMFKQKEKNLEEVQKKVDIADLTLQKKEEDINIRLATLRLKEKEYDDNRKGLEKKEKDLLALEQKLNDREKIEMQKLLDEHNAVLDGRKQAFELELDQKSKSVDDDLKRRIAEVEKKEIEINHSEQKVLKREQALEKKLEKLKEKEKDFEGKLKLLKEKEGSIKIEKQNLETDKKKMHADKEDLLHLKDEVEKMKDGIQHQQLMLCEERERLKVTEEERAKLLHLQSELRGEVENYRAQNELLLKESEDLKQQRNIFERDWEELDNKKADLELELRDICEQKERFNKKKQSEEESLRKEELATKERIEMDLESLKIAKESFAVRMHHEQSAFSEKVESERAQMLHNLDTHKRQIETEMQKRQEEMEAALHEKIMSFEEERERELANINYLREVAHREMEEMKSERQRMEKEKWDVDTNKKHLEQRQLEMRKDTDELVLLSGKLKVQREQLIQERERFVAFIEKHKSCEKCGEVTGEFVLSDLQPVPEFHAVKLPGPKESADNAPIEQPNEAAPTRRNNESLEGVGPSPSAGTISWLRKCTSKLFIFSPAKKIGLGAVHGASEEEVSGKSFQIEPSKSPGGAGNIPESSSGAADDSFYSRRIPSSSFDREVAVAVAAVEDLSVGEQGNIDSEAREVPEVSKSPGLIKNKLGKRGKSRGVINRTRSVKDVVEDAKTLLGDSIDDSKRELSNGTAEDSSRINPDESDLAGERNVMNGRKRGRTVASQATAGEHGCDVSEGQSDSITAGQPKRRRKKVAPPAPTTRYNLRRPRIEAAAVSEAKAANDGGKRNERERSHGGRTGEGFADSIAPATLTGLVSEKGESTQYLQAAAAGSGERENGMAKNVVLSEEVNGGTTLECGGGEGRSGEDEEEDEESEDTGEGSVGKKLWTFFTT